MEHLVISTPGRLCLFGEHQDYLGLPVVPAAISLHLTISGRRATGNEVFVHLPDIGNTVRFSALEPIHDTQSHDYLRSAVVVLQRHGFTFSHGVECTIRSRIPMSAGTSCSSALSVGWVNFLSRLSDQQRTLSSLELARYAYEAEVVEFNEAGGMMDQCTTAFGGVLAIDFLPTFSIQQLDVELGTFVLGDSQQPKDTQAVLRRVNNSMLEIVNALRQRYPDFSLMQLTTEKTEKYRHTLSPLQLQLLKGTVRNFELTKQGRTILSTKPLSHQQLGDLLTEHHRILRDVLKISTQKIDRMLDKVLEAGAYGGKINGSGGGGCMFA